MATRGILNQTWRHRAVQLRGRILAATCFLGLGLCSIAEVATGTHTVPPLRVALTGKYPPFNFYSASGDVCGFDVDVAEAIGRELGRKVEIITTEWDGILAGLLAGKYNAIVGSMAVTPERSQRVDFSTPYYESGAQIFVHVDQTNAIRSVGDLEGRRVGVGLGETYEHFLRENHPDVEVVTYKGIVDVYQDMRNHRLDAFCTDRLVGMYQIKQGDMPFAPAGPLLYREQMAIPVTKGNEVLLAGINAALSALEREGDLDAFHAKWFGASPTGTTARMPTSTAFRMLGRGFAITLGVAATALLAGFCLALPWGMGLHGGPAALHAPLRFLNDFVRGTPLLIQLFFVYFGAPQVGIALTPITSAVLTLAVSCAAYMAEALRSGLMAVDPGQRRAGQSLGLNRLQVFHHVVWPQAFRVSIPSLMNIVVAFVKDTALISVISVGEVVREAQSIISVTFNPMKYYLIVAAMFFIITFPLMKLAAIVERRIKAKGFQHA